MQDTQQPADIPGGGGGGGDSEGGRFLDGGRQMLPPHNHMMQQQPAALKCPRCDSLNTKFCYYNNYNLSQPRHFCKSCRRYWTKGGVLRNVPVGGGFRKNKRVNHKSGETKHPRNSKTHTQSFAVVPPEPSAATATNISFTVTSPVSSAGVSYNSNTNNNCYSDSQFFSFDNHPPLISPPTTNQQIFQPEIGGLETLIAPQMMMIQSSQTTSFCTPPREQLGTKEVMNRHMTTEWVNGGNGVEEEGGMFDLTAALDPAYWSHHQWTDSDPPPLNFLP